MKRIADATGPAVTLCLLMLLALLGYAGCYFDTSGITPSPGPDPDEYYKCQDKMKKCGQGTLQVQVNVSGPAAYNIGGTVQQDAAFDVNAPLYSNTGNTWIVQDIGYPRLKGAILLRTNRDHWNVATGEYLNVDFPSFEHIGDVYVAYDARVNPKPQWLLDTQKYQPVNDVAGKQRQIVTLTPDATKASPTVRLALYRVAAKGKGHPFGEPMWKIPGNNCLMASPGAPGGCAGAVTWPKNLPDKNKAMYVVIVTRKEVPDCAKGTVQESTIYEGCQKAEQDAKDDALKKCDEERQRKTEIGQNPAYFQCLEPVCEKAMSCPKQSGLVQSRSFPVSSVVEFAPAKYKSEASISVKGQQVTKKVEGLIYFEYLLDEFDSMKELRVDSMELKVEPLETDAGTFTNIVLVLREKTRATCQESPPPYGGDRPCTHYAIPAGAFKVLLGANKEDGTLLFDPGNKALLDIQIDHTQRTFRIKGGPLTTTVQVDGDKLPLDIDIDLFGHFLNFAPHAVGRKESTRWVECSAGRDKGRSNRDPILLHSAGSFEVYKDPIPPKNFEWYEDYTWPPERLLGTGPKLTIPAHQMSLGVHQITLLVRDPFGIADTDTFPVEVRDTQAPQITVPQDVHYLVTPPGKPPVEVPLGTAWATDLCFGDVEITNDAPKDGRFPAGVTTVTWTAEDGSGNKDSGVQKVHVYTVADTTDPARLAPLLKTQAKLLLEGIKKTRGAVAGCEEPGLRAVNPRALGESTGRMADLAERMRVPDDGAAARDQAVAKLRRSESEIARAGGILESAQAAQREGERRELCQASSGALAGAAEGIEQAMPLIEGAAAAAPRPGRVAEPAPERAPEPKPPPEPEAGGGRCEQYAQISLAQARQNIERACGFVGGRWSTDHRTHYDWCQKATAQQTAEMVQQRGVALGTQCAASRPSIEQLPPPAVPAPPSRQVTPRAGGNEARCQTYAERALASAQQNLDRGCGYTGRRWLTDYDAHYRWCLGAPKLFADMEANARAADLNRCGAARPSAPPPRAPLPERPAPPPPPQPVPDNRARCSAYAGQAVAQARESVTRRCGFTGPRWSADYNTHYNWCLGVPQAAADAESQARTSELRDRCHGIPLIK